MDRPLPSKDEIIRIANAEPDERTLEDAHTMIEYLMHHIGIQGQVVLGLRGDVEMIGGILAGAAEQAKPKIIMPVKPKLEIN